MNEFVEQFLLEARELVEQATDDLLALEGGARGPERIDSLFRAFHTLKGAAGIVDFAAMGRALHAAEEILSGVRSGTRPLSPAIVDDCFACLDQVTAWLDGMQASGGPPADADAAADRIVRSFVGSAPGAADHPAALERDRDWLDHLPDGHREARTALRYRPDGEAFFRGEDPLALVADIPDLVAIDLAWQKDIALADLDPFACLIEIVALSRASAAEVSDALGSVIGQVDVAALDHAAPDPRLSADARTLLQAQINLLGVSESEGKAGRLGAAGRVAANVLHHAGLAAEAAGIENALAESMAGDDTARLVAAIENALAAKPQADTTPDTGGARAAQGPAARALRVDMERIDALVNLTGELTVVKNAFGHLAAQSQGGADAASFAAGLREQQARFDRLVGELQRAVLRIRVLPLRQVFARFPRLVREIAATLHKPVRFVTEGDATEADTAVVESLFEPLLHILRNAIDHGIEAAARREQLGKPAVATLVLRARRLLDNVVVEVEDDGGGIDLVRVRQAATARNLVTAAELDEMSETDIVNLIFAPGFSTAAEVTGLSGRGVGMDSVKSAVQRLGGHVGVETRADAGTVVRLSLPFTVMMTRVMTVETAGQVFGFPLDTVVETAMVARDHIVAVGAGRAFVLRDRTVPLIDLAASLGLATDRADGDARVVVTSAAGQLGGIEVERLGERMDVMLKPMDRLLSGMKGVAGTTLLGDGRVLIVLDIQELFQ